MTQDVTDEALGELTERDKVALFIGRNAERYLRLYDEMIAFEDEDQAARGRAFRVGDADFFSLPILLVAPLWLVYRKFYMWAAVWFAVVFVWDLITMNLMPQGAVSNVAFYGVLIGASVWAALSLPIRYVKYARRRAAEAGANDLARAGGTSWLSVLVCLAILFGIEALLAQLIPAA